jgi:hypothetical protein
VTARPDTVPRKNSNGESTTEQKLAEELVNRLRSRAYH